MADLLRLVRYADMIETAPTLPMIMVVDDSPTNLELIEGILQAEGFRTVSARDGATARQLGDAHPPDLILLDVVMPGESGLDTCAKLKSNPRTSEIPIIFLSALNDVKSKVAGLKCGGVDYISKPVHGEEVLARVRVHLRIAQNSRALVDVHRTRLESLRTAQRSILVRPEDRPQASFSIFYEPLEETGGDFYDVLELDNDTYGYFVADVSGHGTSAAFLTSAVKALLRQYAGPLYTPEDTMRGVDAVMRQMLGEEQYLTACYALLNRRARRLSVVSAGHPPLILVGKDRKARAIEMDGDPLGIFSSVVLHRRDLRVAPGDRFYLYSDGLIEAVPGGSRRTGMARLTAECERHAEEPLSITPGLIAQALQDGGAPQDDLLLLAVEVPS